jgi:glycosyltransferase involved in cell wall biosynthesis
MAELVKHEENGLLFAQGNPKSLREAMERIMDERGLIDKLRKNIPAVKTIEANAEELIGIYRRLLNK